MFHEMMVKQELLKMLSDGWLVGLLFGAGG